jgi:hypothetical protein
MINGRCRLHGGKSLSGKEHGRYNHGRFTKAAKEQRRYISMLLKKSNELLRDISPCVSIVVASNRNSRGDSEHVFKSLPNLDGSKDDVPRSA